MLQFFWQSMSMEHFSIKYGLFFSQNPLIQPTVGPDVSGTVTTELLQGLSEIVAEDTNNILVQVFI